jgi:hypothetical protein
MAKKHTHEHSAVMNSVIRLPSSIDSVWTDTVIDVRNCLTMFSVSVDAAAPPLLFAD